MGTNRRVDRAVATQVNVKPLHVGGVVAAPAHVDADRRAAVVADATTAEPLEERVFALVYRQMHALFGRHRADFDDLVQVAAEQALASLPSFRGESELSTWTYRICYRSVLRHRRWVGRWLRRFTLEAPTVEPADHAPDAAAALEQRERMLRLRHALDRLSDKRRAVVVLRDLEGLDIPSIATIVGTSEGTVRSRLRDGRRNLAALLETDPYFGDEACSEELR